MRNNDSQNRVQMMYVAVVLVLVLLIMNSFLLARTAGYIQFPGEMSKTDIAREGAFVLVEYHEQVAEDAGVLDSQSVRDSIAQFKFEVERASTPEDIARLKIIHSRNLQDVIAREEDSKRREAVLSVIKDDPGLDKFRGDTTITITRNQNGVEVSDPAGRITESTIDKLNELPELEGDWALIEVYIRNGQPSLQTPRSIEDQLSVLENRIQDLSDRLNELQVRTGHASMSGPGIVVELYDAENGFQSMDIVHDRDVRDLVNELFAAGSAGVAVGDQRLIATSSVRCVGPIILVNQQPVVVDPVVIKAVGNPEVLSSSLKLILRELQEFDIKGEISEQENITLPAYDE